VALTNTQVDALSTNLKTSDWWNSTGGRPKSLWELNQASTATALTDLSGAGADQTPSPGQQL
jgi:hypothetical protein